MLTTIKALDKAIYAVMVAAILHVLYCGITGTQDILLAASIGLVGLEGAVFLGNGRKCPLTPLAQRYADPKGYVGDIFLPEWLAHRVGEIIQLTFRTNVRYFLPGIQKQISIGSNVLNEADR